MPEFIEYIGPELIEYIGPICQDVCAACGGCASCCAGTCQPYAPQEDPDA